MAIKNNENYTYEMKKFFLVAERGGLSKRLLQDLVGLLG
jgi:hypothetical protein